jgi:hypothetical protein
MNRNLAATIATATIAEVGGTFFRHSSPRFRSLKGSSSGGRWGARGAYPVLYLGRPIPSIIAEAYRKLVDGVEGMSGDRVAARKLLTCEVVVTEVLDLRTTESREVLGITDDLFEGPNEPCQMIGRAAHQLGLHGILAPAATRLGETLALFEEHLPADELPRLVAEELWNGLPADPRKLRLADRRQA